MKKDPGPLEGTLVRLFLLLYPPRMRRAHGEDMRAFLSARLVRARVSRGWSGVLGVWWMAWKDLAITAARELTDRRPSRDQQRKRTAGMGSLIQDLRYGVRRLARTPFFTLGALAILALAIGANTAVFAIVNQVLLVPPPYENPDRVVNIYQDSDDGEPSSNSFPAYRDMSGMGDVFQAVAATSPDQATLEEGDRRSSLAIEFTTSSLLKVIGRTPARGRWFDGSMDHVGAGNYAVVSHYAWENRFGSDPGIVGRTLRLNGEPVTVIGVGPEGYNGMGGFLVSDLWLSISSVGINGDFRVANLDRREDHWYQVTARLAPGVSVAQAQEALDALARRLAETYPELNAGRDITVFSSMDVRLHPDADRDLYSGAFVLLSVVLLVLVLASTNLGGLLLVRGVSRGPEVAVRKAMGAAPSRIFGIFLCESLTLSMAGGFLGILLAYWLLGLAQTLPLSFPVGGEFDLAIDGRVLLASLALMLGTGIFFGWAPAVQSNTADLATSLREDQRTSWGTRRLSLFRNLMVAVQVAVSVVLVVGAGVMVKSLRSYYSVDTGVDLERLAAVHLDFTQAGIPQEEMRFVTDEVLQRLSALPGVESVALASRLPVQGAGTTTTVVEDYDPPAGTGSVELSWAVVTPGYFETLGIGVMEGRVFSPEDNDNFAGLVVVNEALARFWGEGSALGRRIRPQGAPDAWRSVIGVVEDTKIRNLSEPPTPMLYYVLGDRTMASPYFLLRTPGDPGQLLPSIRAQLVAVTPSLGSASLATMEDVVAESITTPKISSAVLGLFSFLALLLASVGIYTLVSFSVAGRMPEIGIRVALGAQRGRVVRTVMGEVALTVVIGLSVGAGLVALVAPRLQGALFGAEILSLATLLPALAVLGGTVALAAYLPARRAAAADPVEALRAQ